MSRPGQDLDMDVQSLSSVSAASASFCSGAGSSCFSEGSSFEIESEVGRDALVQICCSSLSRLLDFPDSQLETLLGSGEDEQATGSEGDGGTNVARYYYPCWLHNLIHECFQEHSVESENDEAIHWQRIACNISHVPPPETAQPDGLHQPSGR